MSADNFFRDILGFVEMRGGKRGGGEGRWWSDVKVAAQGGHAEKRKRRRVSGLVSGGPVDVV